MNKIIYMDNAATTKVKSEVFEEMKPYFLENYGNPSSIYFFADSAKRAVDRARINIASLINASVNEIYFTAGGSESDNWAIKATAEVYKQKGKHIITSKIEHHAILNTCRYLENRGFEITYLDVDENGMVDVDELKYNIREDTILISIMTANNEVGTIEPIAEIGKIAHEHNVLFHTDAVQAFGHIEIDVKESYIDLLSASAHKINGPKGVGMLYIKNGLKIGSFIHGGAQERQRRAGTLNVPGIVGFGKAVEIANDNMKKISMYECNLRDYFIDRIQNEIQYVKLNGHRTERLSNNINFCFKFIEGESLLIMLDQKGICVSSGSACTSGSLDPSHVLLAMGVNKGLAHSSLRITISEENTKEEADFVIEQIKNFVNRLRSMSTAYKELLEIEDKDGR